MTPAKREEVLSIAGQFENEDIYPTDIALQHGPGFDPRLNDKLETFSRFSWSNEPHDIFTKEVAESGRKPIYLVRFHLNTLTTIGMGEFIPTEEEIPEDRIIGTIAIGFAVEYLVPKNPHEIDIDVLSMIERIKVFNDAWPFWREALQALALRARLPVPVLPAQRPSAMLLIPEIKKKRAKKAPA